MSEVKQPTAEQRKFFEELEAGQRIEALRDTVSTLNRVLREVCHMEECPVCHMMTMHRWDAIATARACQNSACKHIEERRTLDTTDPASIVSESHPDK